MGWIKRNLYFSIGGFIALAMLGGAGFYTFISWQRNNEAFHKLNDIYTSLKTISSKKPQFGNDKVNNIKLAQEHEQQFRQWIAQAKKHFKPIAPIPNPANGQYTSQLFGDALSRTVARLQDEAAAAGVGLPPNYKFSFQAESSAVKFAPESLLPLSEQVGAVAAITETLYAAHVNGLENVQRLRVTSEDAPGQQGDYLNGQPLTNSLAVLMPYQVTFRAFTPEIAHVLVAFATSTNGILVRTMNVLPVSETPVSNNRILSPNMTPQPPSSQPMPIRSGSGAQEFLNEQLLRVTMEIEIVKLAPGA